MMSLIENPLRRLALGGLARFMLALALMLFLPAWTPWFWQAWLYLAVFGGLCFAGTLYFLKHDPSLVRRRLAVGPTAEREPSQKRIMVAASLAIVLVYVVAGFDRRFHGSAVPIALAMIGEAGVAAGLLMIFRVFKENTYTAATVGVSARQTVVATGPYALVRHPMYSASLVLYAATPLALGSYWALLPAAGLAAAIVWRLIDEERVLVRDLEGYAAYRERVRYRLIPSVW